MANPKLIHLLGEIVKKVDKMKPKPRYEDREFGIYSLPCKVLHIPNYNKKVFKGLEKEFETRLSHSIMIPGIFCNVKVVYNVDKDTYDVSICKFDEEVFWMIIDTIGEE